MCTNLCVFQSVVSGSTIAPPIARGQQMLYPVDTDNTGGKKTGELDQMTFKKMSPVEERQSEWDTD